MNDKVPRVSLAAFLLAVFCFVLPFVTLSCPGQRIHLTGYQVAAGTTLESPNGMGGTETRRIQPDLLAAGAALCLVGGLLLSIRKGRDGILASLALAALAALQLLVFRSHTASEVLREGGGMIRVEFGLGYWGALFLSVAAGALQVVRLQGGERAAPTSAAVAEERAPGPG